MESKRLVLETLRGVGALEGVPILVPFAAFEGGAGRLEPVLSGCHPVRCRRGDAYAQPALVGRDPGADICLPDHRVSWHHASFERSGAHGELIVFDAGSRNGVTVDRVRLRAWTARRVLPFAVIGFGPVEYVFVDAQAAVSWLAGAARDERAR